MNLINQEKVRELFDLCPRLESVKRVKKTLGYRDEINDLVVPVSINGSLDYDSPDVKAWLVEANLTEKDLKLVKAFIKDLRLPQIYECFRKDFV